MGPGLDFIPRVAGHVPALGRLVLERVEIFGLSRKQVEHDGVFEQAAGVALAHEFLQVGAEQRTKYRVRLRVDQRLHDRARIDLPEGRRLLGHDLHAGLLLLHELLEPQRGRLAVLVIGIDDCPFLFFELDRIGDQHCGLHVRRRPQPEGVAVAVFPDDLVGQRLGRDEDDFALGGEIAHGEADVGWERAHQEAHVLAGDEFFGHAHGIARVAVVIAGNHLYLATQDPAGFVDLIESQFPAFFVRVEERGEDLVAVELADLDRLRLGSRADQEQAGAQYGQGGVKSFHRRSPSRVVAEMLTQPQARPFFRATACRSAGRKTFSYSLVP